MIGKKFQLFFYNNNVMVGTGGQTVLLMDTPLVEAYAAYTVRTEIQSWSGVHMTNLNAVNNFFGCNVINRDLRFYTQGDTSSTPQKIIPTWYKQALNTLGLTWGGLTLDNYNNTYYRTVNGNQYQDVMSGMFVADNEVKSVNGNAPINSVRVDKRDSSFSIDVRVLREDAFNKTTGYIEKPTVLDIHIEGYLSGAYDYISSCKIFVQESTSGVGIWSPAFNLNEVAAEDVDPENPFPGGDPDDGGDGDNRDPEIDPTEVPDLPDISIANSGLITIYEPTLTNLQNLGAFLWSGLFDPDTFKKLFADPMQAMIGLAILPKVPASAGSKNIKFGNVDSGVNAAYFTTQYCKQDCGSVKINKQIGSFLDYDHTSISIFLPFIGFREIDARDVMGASISVVYNIDILNGSCAAFIKHSTKGVIYAFNGSCITNVPLTAANYSGAIQNAVSCVASAAGVIAGAVSGAAPVTMASAASMLSAGANTIMNSKPQIQRSGNLGGSAGMLTAKKPFIIIERPNYSVPEFYQNYEGRMCNKTAKLGNCSGFTMVDAVHLDNVGATTSEITEIESMLKAGVIL